MDIQFREYLLFFFYNMSYIYIAIQLENYVIYRSFFYKMSYTLIYNLKFMSFIDYSYIIAIQLLDYIADYCYTVHMTLIANYIMS